MSQATHERVTEPLRAEHRHLLPHVDQLASAGAAVGRAAADALQAEVDEAYHFLTAHLIPHATAEDEVLYPEVDGLLGTRGGTRATDTMRRDHVEVVRLTERLGELRARLHDGVAEEDELRRVLHGLHAVVGLHFAKEEEVYLPLLDRELTAAEAEALFLRMEEAGHAAGASHAH
jgi:iron-sulfur cluster repair protein YtfE (RIC family)